MKLAASLLMACPRADWERSSSVPVARRLHNTPASYLAAPRYPAAPRTTLPLPSARNARRAAVALLAATALIALRSLSPSQLRWLPACPVRQHFHLLCPGCGATHALLALLHGRLAEAWSDNPAFILLLLYPTACAAIAALRYQRGARRPWPETPRALPAAALAAALVFGILRNL